MIAPLIKKLEHYLTLPQEDKRLLEDSISRVEYIEKRQEIISEGQRPDFVHLLLEGWACRYKHVKQGKRSIMAYLIPGDLCDVHIALLDHMDHSIGTLTPVKLAYIPREKIDHLIRHNNTLTRAVFWTMLLEESTMREWFVNTNNRLADKRLAHIFCEMLVRYFAAGLTEDTCIDFPLTQDDLADSMGLTVVHTNRVLQRLRKDRMVEFEDKKLWITDWRRLRTFAEFDPGYLHISEDFLKGKIPHYN